MKRAIGMVLRAISIISSTTCISHGIHWIRIRGFYWFQQDVLILITRLYTCTNSSDEQSDWHGLWGQSWQSLRSFVLFMELIQCESEDLIDFTETFDVDDAIAHMHKFFRWKERMSIFLKGILTVLLNWRMSIWTMTMGSGDSFLPKSFVLPLHEQESVLTDRGFWFITSSPTELF
jgi:hypothetical protein